MKLFFLTLLFSISSSAQIYRLDSALNIRTTNTDFISKNNVVGHISAGTEFKIISSKTLRSGAKALEIKIIKKGQGSALPINFEKLQSIYIYQNKKIQFKRMSNSEETEASTLCLDGSCEQSASDPHSQMAEQNVVKTSEGLLAAFEGQSSVPSSLQQQIKNYENSPVVEKTISAAMKYIRATIGGGRCYEKTKLLLTKGGLITETLDGEYARSGVEDLKKLNFINLLESPNDLKLTPDTAPKGSVLVYKSNVKCDNNKKTGNTMETGCGHIEIKLGDGKNTKSFKYASDFKSIKPITEGSSSSNYELIGVMIKPNLGESK